MTSTPSLRENEARDQAPPGLLIATLGADETGMKVYAQGDETLQLWRRYGSGLRHFATVTGPGEITWSWRGLELPQFKRDSWETKVWTVLHEHRRATS